MHIWSIIFFLEVEQLGFSTYPLLCSSQLFIPKCWAACHLIHSHSERPWNFLATFLVLQWSLGSELFLLMQVWYLFLWVFLDPSGKNSWGTKTRTSFYHLKVVTGHNFIHPVCCLPGPISLYSNQIIFVSLSHIFMMLCAQFTTFSALIQCYQYCIVPLSCSF